MDIKTLSLAHVYFGFADASIKYSDYLELCVDYSSSLFNNDLASICWLIANDE